MELVAETGSEVGYPLMLKWQIIGGWWWGRGLLRPIDSTRRRVLKK